MDQKHVTVLRHNRTYLIRGLPHVETLLKMPGLRNCFSPYEKEQVLAELSPPDQAAKLLDFLELKSVDVYEQFVAALMQFRPEVARRLQGIEREVSNSSSASSPGSNGSESPPFSVRESHRGRQTSRPAEVASPSQPSQENGEEDAGPYGLKGSGPGLTHRLSHLSYECRELLAAHLNGNPPERNTFRSFCRALGVEKRLLQASLRSGNPTAYLIQQYSEEPEATMQRLEQALSQIGKSNVFDELWQKVLTDGMSA